MQWLQCCSLLWHIVKLEELLFIKCMRCIANIKYKYFRSDTSWMEEMFERRFSRLLHTMSQARPRLGFGLISCSSYLWLSDSRRFYTKTALHLSEMHCLKSLIRIIVYPVKESVECWIWILSHFILLRMASDAIPPSLYGVSLHLGSVMVVVRNQDSTSEKVSIGCRSW